MKLANAIRLLKKQDGYREIASGDSIVYAANVNGHTVGVYENCLGLACPPLDISSIGTMSFAGRALTTHIKLMKTWEPGTPFTSDTLKERSS